MFLNGLIHEGNWLACELSPRLFHSFAWARRCFPKKVPVVFRKYLGILTYDLKKIIYLLSILKINFYWSVAAFSVVLVLAVQWSESAICIHNIYPLIFGIPSQLDHYRALMRVPVLYRRFSLAVYFTCCSVKLLPLCSALCDLMDCSPPGSSVREISQARTLEWVAMSFSRGSYQLRNQTCVSYTCLLYWQAGSSPLAPPGKPLPILCTISIVYIYVNPNLPIPLTLPFPSCPYIVSISALQIRSSTPFF